MLSIGTLHKVDALVIPRKSSSIVPTTLYRKVNQICFGSTYKIVVEVLEGGDSVAYVDTFLQLLVHVFVFHDPGVGRLIVVVVFPFFLITLMEVKSEFG